MKNRSIAQLSGYEIGYNEILQVIENYAKRIEYKPLRYKPKYYVDLGKAKAEIEKRDKQEQIACYNIKGTISGIKQLIPVSRQHINVIRLITTKWAYILNAEELSIELFEAIQKPLPPLNISIDEIEIDSKKLVIALGFIARFNYMLQVVEKVFKCDSQVFMIDMNKDSNIYIQSFNLAEHKQKLLDKLQSSNNLKHMDIIKAIPNQIDIAGINNIKASEKTLIREAIKNYYLSYEDGINYLYKLLTLDNSKLKQYVI